MLELGPEEPLTPKRSLARASIGHSSCGRACLLPVMASISLLQAWGILSSVEDLRKELNDLNTFGPAPRL